MIMDEHSMLEKDRTPQNLTVFFVYIDSLSFYCFKDFFKTQGLFKTTHVNHVQTKKTTNNHTVIILYQPQNYMEKASLPSWALVPGTEILLQVTIFKWSWHLENRTRNVTDKLCDVTKHASLIAGRKRISQQNTAIYILSESRGGGDIQTVRDNFTVVSRNETQREKMAFLKEALSVLMLCTPSNRRQTFLHHIRFLVKQIDINSQKFIEYGK